MISYSAAYLISSVTISCMKKPIKHKTVLILLTSINHSSPSLPVTYSQK